MTHISIAALLFAAFFATAALYISIVEHPARMALADGPALSQWQPSYRRALPIQSGLAIAGGAAGLILWWLSADWRWLAGSMLLLANWPFTLVAIMPVNKRLMAMRADEAGAGSRAMLAHWGKLHHVRSALGLATAGLFAWALTALH